jgi:Na+/H+ antiporter NhaD/arsenite permease-like protein
VCAQEYVWVVVAWVSTVAGNLTLLGSAANIIVAELNTTRHLTFFQYLKFGFPTTLVIVTLGLVILYGTSAVF